jgi:shikimate kinase
MSDERQRPTHLVLIGLPGSGKSTIGSMVAEKLERPFFDLDIEIEKTEGRTVSEIFAADGEPYFRRRERNLTESLSQGESMVLASGGGWVCDPQNVRHVRPPGRLVYLRVSPEGALARMGDDVATRPLLKRPDPLEELRRLYAERDRFYMDADLFIDTELIGIEELTQVICDYARTVEVA